MVQHYTFGDDDRAAGRLRKLAAVYAPTSSALLQRFAGSAPRLAVDLGAGLGLTTRLVHAATGAERTLGLDSSTRYVEQAAADAPPGVTFAVHDVTRGPFPCGPADFLYARFLLTHLADPVAALAAWRAGASPQATLVVEETAELLSEDPALGRYYTLVDEMQRHYGQALRIGRSLARLAAEAGWRSVDEHSLGRARVTAVPVSAAQMAELHVDNLRTWRRDPFAVRHLDASELAELEVALGAIASGRTQASVRVEIGQLVATR